MTFASDSPFNTKISTDATVDPDGEAIVTGLVDEGVQAGVLEFGIPIYDADDHTPRYTIHCNEPETWGICPLEGVSVPIPDAAKPQTGSDGAMVVIDRANDRVYEFWQAVKSGNSWSATWGSISRLSGDGWSSTATGAGASRLGGVIRTSEIKSGVIPHALVMQSSRTCHGVFRSPATKTDGTSTLSDCVPEGTRLQLDPSLDLGTLTTLTPAERAVAVALQTYGAFVIDSGGAKLSMSFERPVDATDTNPGAVYDAAGLSWDYMSLTGIPWSELRVLASSNKG